MMRTTPARRLLFALMAATCGLLSPFAGAAETMLPADNPFASASPLPLHYPPFDKIRDDHYAPAFAAGMAEHLKQVEAVANDPAQPTFDNTLAVLERSGQLLERVNNVFSNLVGTITNETLQALEKEMAAKLAAHYDAVLLNPALFRRVDDLFKRRAELKLDPESDWLLVRYHRDLVRAGARLSEADKVKLKALNQQIAELQAVFGQNVQKASNAGAVLVETRAELAGLTDTEIAAAEEAAKAAGKPGKFLLPLLNTTGQPSLDSLQNRALRQRIHEASVQRNVAGEHDNRPVIVKLARLRAERAALLGYETHAAYQVEDQTAATVPAVNGLLAQLAPAAVANARREAADMQAMIDAEKGGFALAPWDWSFYAEKVRRSRYAFDEAQLKPYLELNRVLHDGVFFAATKLYGITFKERHDLPVYEPSVRVFDVIDSDGSLLAIFVADFYARPNKRGGAWMNSYVNQSSLLNRKAIVANHLNVTKPAPGEPALLTWDDVITLFHEFGHALHGLFSNVRYPRFTGTEVPRDFVEYPSQVNEMWATWPEVLRNYARHHKTGEPMPAELLAKMEASKKFNQGFRTTEYLAATLLDQAWHQLKADRVSAPEQVLEFEAATLKRHGLDFAPVPPRYHSPYFLHAFYHGYSAGYYSYIWSEVLDADTVEWFKENGGLTRKNGEHFRETLLSRGGSQESLSLYKTFRGRPARIEPLLERRGLAAGKSASP